MKYVLHIVLFHLISQCQQWHNLTFSYLKINNNNPNKPCLYHILVQCTTCKALEYLTHLQCKCKFVCLVLISAIAVLFWGVGGRDKEKVVQCTCISLSQNMMYSMALALILQYMLCTEVQSDIQPVQTATNRHFVSHTKASCHKFLKKMLNCFINKKTVFL